MQFQHHQRVIFGLQNFEDVHFSADVHPICGKFCKRLCKPGMDGAEHFPAGRDEDENPRCGRPLSVPFLLRISGNQVQIQGRSYYCLISWMLQI